MTIRRWRDDLDGTWHESGDLDQWDVDQDAARLREEYEQQHRPKAKPRRNPRRV